MPEYNYKIRFTSQAAYFYSDVKSAWKVDLTASGWLVVVWEKPADVDAIPNGVMLPPHAILAVEDV